MINAIYLKRQRQTQIKSERLHFSTIAINDVMKIIVNRVVFLHCLSQPNGIVLSELISKGVQSDGFLMKNRLRKIDSI